MPTSSGGLNTEILERIQTALQKAKRQHGPMWLAEQTATTPPNGTTSEMWARLPFGKITAQAIEENRLVTLSDSDQAHTAFDMMRTRVLQALRQNHWSSVAITSPTAGCGKTAVGLNLAFSMANQKDCRTVLVDLDLRRPRVGAALGVRNPPPIADFLKGHQGIEDTFLRYGENVAIASNSQPERLAAELLQSPETARALQSLKQKLAPDVILFDLPPMLSNDDVTAFLPNVDCAILVVEAEASTLAEIDLCERELSQKSNVLGVVLNKCRYTPDKYGY